MEAIEGLQWSGIIVAWIAGMFSLIILILKLKENKKRDEAQIRRDEAHIANEIYKRVGLEKEKGVEGKVKAEVRLYKDVLNEVKTQVDIKK